nr:unnamed protein product [Spirometra erinaceieuropaei]
MGSPISGFIAEAVLQRLESLVFQRHRPKFWSRYVDDTFVVIERDQVLTFQENLNAVFPDIQFTMEEEENKQLAFLDVLVCRKDCGELKNQSVQESDKYDASTELQQQPPDQPQTQLLGTSIRPTSCISYDNRCRHSSVPPRSTVSEPCCTFLDSTPSNTFENASTLVRAASPPTLTTATTTTTGEKTLAAPSQLPPTITSIRTAISYHPRDHPTIRCHQQYELDPNLSPL